MAAAAVAVYASCVVRAVGGERLRRELFTVHCALSTQSQQLSEDASVRQYRKVLLANRKIYGMAGSLLLAAAAPQQKQKQQQQQHLQPAVAGQPHPARASTLG